MVAPARHDGSYTLQCSAPVRGRRPPVDAAQRVAGLVGADAGDARRVFVKPVRQPNVADRPSEVRS